MIFVRTRKKFKWEGCSKERSFGVEGTRTAEYCAQHVLDEMMNVK